MVEGNWHQRMPLPCPYIEVKYLGQPFNEARIVVVFVPIFEPDNRIKYFAFGAVTGPRPFEVPDAINAIRTKKAWAVIFEAGIGIATLLAKGLLDPHGFRRVTLWPWKGQIQRAFSPASGSIKCG